MICISAGIWEVCECANKMTRRITPVSSCIYIDMGIYIHTHIYIYIYIYTYIYTCESGRGRVHQMKHPDTWIFRYSVTAYRAHGVLKCSDTPCRRARLMEVLRDTPIGVQEQRRISVIMLPATVKRRIGVTTRWRKC